jgi:hypothetical protein
MVWSVVGFDVFAIYSTNPLTGAPAGSIHLAEAFFPFDLLFALVNSYFIFVMTVGRALLVYAAVARYFFGG